MPVTEENLERLLDEVRFSLKFRIYDNAIIILNEIISEFINPEIIFLFAKTYLEFYSPKQCVAICKRYIKEVMCSTECRLLYAKALMESGFYSECEEVLQKYLESPVKEGEEEYQCAAHYYLGLVRNRTHRFSSAKPEFQTALAFDPYLIVAVQNQYKDALPPHSDDLEDVTELQPNTLCTQILIEHPNVDPDTISIFPDSFRQSLAYLLAKSSIYFHKSDFDTAYKIFTKLHKDFSFSTLGMDLFSTTLWQLKKKSELNNLSRELIKLAPNMPETWVASGNYYSLHQDADMAVELFLRASSIDQSYSYGLTLAGHEYIAKQFTEQGQNSFREATNRNPLDYSAWYGLGSVLFNENKFRPARYYIKKAQQINKNSSVLKFILGQTEYRCGNTEECLKLFDEAIAMDPQNYAVKYQKGYVLQEEGKIDEAMECFKQVSGPVPDEPSSKYMEGKIELSRGNLIRGVQLLVEALSLGYPNKNEIYSDVSDIINESISSFLK